VWTKKKFLIWGKTYPEFSKSYYETVCTGAVDAETGCLVRIYPVTLRYLKEPFKAYDWVEVEAERNESDFRPESFRIRQDTLKVVGHIDTKRKGEWLERKRWILSATNVFASVEALQAAEAVDHTSLGLVRPKSIRRIYLRRKPDHERNEWDQQRAAALRQKELFVDAETETKDLQFMPVQYRACFRCDDPMCTTEHDLSILDWGVYVLSRREYATGGAAVAERKVIEKIEELLDSTKREPYLFLGNTKAHSQSFMIVGLFHPPIEKTPGPARPHPTLKLPGID